MDLSKEAMNLEIIMLRKSGLDYYANILTALVDEREKLIDELDEYDKSDNNNCWVAVGEYSHTNRRKLWKVLTIPCSKVSAEIYAAIANEDERKKRSDMRKHHFVVKLEKFDDY